MSEVMKKHKALHAISLATTASILAFAAGAALAQDSSYAYGGLAVGATRARIDQDRITAGLLGAGLTTTGMTRDERDTGYKLFGGYQFNRYVAVEAGYFSLGRFGFKSTTAPTGTLSGDIQLRGLNLDFVGTLPISEQWSLLGRLGVQAAHARDRFSGTGAVSVLNPNPSKREANVKVGAGVQYEFSRYFLLRAEAERYRVNDAVGNHGQVDMVSLSAVFPFGRAEQARPRSAAAPAYVTPQRAPEPVVVAAAPPTAALAPMPMNPMPERRRVSFTADSLFGFDHAEVRPDGRTALDQFVQELAGTRYDNIIVEGHTDRLGSTAYNLKLAQERADAVKAYLVGRGGIDAAKISTVAKGESQPVTKPDDCKGERETAKLVVCLQPDRRVEVEVSGTR